MATDGVWDVLTNEQVCGAKQQSANQRAAQNPAFLGNNVVFNAHLFRCRPWTVIGNQLAATVLQLL
jgi:hypothetical protein